MGLPIVCLDLAEGLLGLEKWLRKGEIEVGVPGEAIFKIGIHSFEFRQRRMRSVANGPSDM
jgi:hypothetical protein